MLSVLSASSLHQTSSAEKRRNVDLARFSLDLNSAGVGPRFLGRRGLLLPPPMSGSPPWPSSVNEPRKEPPSSPSGLQLPGQDARDDTASDGAQTTAEAGPTVLGPASLAEPRRPATTLSSTTAAPTTPTTTTTTTTTTATAGSNPPNRFPPSPQVAAPPGPAIFGPDLSIPARRTISYRSTLSSRSTRAPRRAKAHVASACVNCRNKHLACDVNRPCERCVANGTQDTCVDVQHKRRGRPPIRPHTEARSEMTRSSRRIQQHSTVSPAASLGPPHSSIGHSAPSDIFPPLRSRGRKPNTSPIGTTRPFTTPFPYMVPPFGSVYEPLPGYPRPIVTSPHARDSLLAVLQMDLTVIRTTTSFCRALLTEAENLQNRTLLDVVAPPDQGRLQQLQRAVNGDRLQWDRTYLPPMYEHGDVNQQVHGLSEAELLNLAQESQDRVEDLRLMLANGHPRMFRLSFRLARISTFYVIVALLLGHSPVQSALELPASSPQLGYASQPTHSPVYGPPPLGSPFMGSSRPLFSPSGRSEPTSSPRYPARALEGSTGRPYEHTSSRHYPRVLDPVTPDPRFLGAMSPLSPELSYPPHPASQPPARQRSDAPPQLQEVARDHPRELQLPPIRDPTQSPAVGGEESGSRRRRRDEYEGEQDEGGEPESGRRKRQRVSVEEIVE